MNQPASIQPSSRLDAFRERFGHRAAAISVAVLLELLLLTALLTLGRSSDAPGMEDGRIVSFDVQAPPAPQPEETPDTQDMPQPAPAEAQRDQPEPLPPPPQLLPRPAQAQSAPAPTPPAIIPMERGDLASADISNLPRRRPDAPAGPAPGPAFGPAAPSSAGDTAIVGRAPNGQPLYAAAWYREPTDGELAGYLSTASGPGWALIACRTAPGWRVENCVGLEEFPAGSNMQRAVLAAAWQFQVRPPRRGGQVLVGEWVRIRIEYTVRGQGVR